MTSGKRLRSKDVARCCMRADQTTGWTWPTFVPDPPSAELFAMLAPEP